MASSPGVVRSQIAKELGINYGMLARWYKEFEKEGKARDEEMAALKRELARVRKERDFLKDAAAFVAGEPYVRWVPSTSHR